LVLAIGHDIAGELHFMGCALDYRVDFATPVVNLPKSGHLWGVISRESGSPAADTQLFFGHSKVNTTDQSVIVKMQNIQAHWL
jgi:hypothetical protein